MWKYEITCRQDIYEKFENSIQFALKRIPLCKYRLVCARAIVNRHPNSRNAVGVFWVLPNENEHAKNLKINIGLKICTVKNSRECIQFSVACNRPQSSSYAVSANGKYPPNRIVETNFRKSHRKNRKRGLVR